MKKTLTLLLLALSASAFGQAKQDSLTFKLDEYFTALTGLKNFNGNVIVSQKGKNLLDKTYNMEGGNDSLKVTRASKFIIASVSKTFIKFGILKLAEMKKMQLADKLSKFIPDFPQGDKITIEQLMYHQSGLPRDIANKDEYYGVSLEKTVALAKSEKLQFEPGTQTTYSNVGYFLLHYIIDKTSPKGYLAFIHDNILDKMKMRNTMEFNSSKAGLVFAYGFDNEGGKVTAAAKEEINRFETGNYLSTIGDLHRFSGQMLAGKALKKDYAIKMFGKDSVFMQAGGRPGYRAYFYRNLKTEVVFIFTANYTDIPFEEVMTDIIKILEGKQYNVPRKTNRIEISLPIETLQKYTGKFALSADMSQVFSIKLIDGKLFFVDADDIKTLLRPDTETSFFEDPTSKDGEVFTLDPQTNLYQLTIISTGLRLATKRLE